MEQENKAEQENRTTDIIVSKKAVIYKLEKQYFSELLNADSKVAITLEVYSDGKISLAPKDGDFLNTFMFEGSDPARVLALAELFETAVEVARGDDE